MSLPGLVALAAFAMAGHWLWTSYFPLWGLAPQLLLVLTVAVAARQGPIPAMGLGFLWGLFLDVLNVRLFGANALALTLVGYGTGSVRRQIDVAGLGPQCVVVLFMTLGYFVLMGIFGLVFARGFLWIGWPQFVFTPFYNAVLSVALFFLWNPWRER